MAAPQAKILVVRGGAIGDFILTLPVFAALREMFPQTRLEVLGYPSVTALAQAAGLVDETRSIESREVAGFFARKIVPAQAWRDYFARFPIILSYLYDPDGIFQDQITGSGGKIQFIQGPHRPLEMEETHATDVFLKPLERLAVFGADPIPRLPGIQSESLSGPGPFLAVHPGSGSEAKNWPEQRWLELLLLLERHSTYRFLLVGGEAEGERLQRLSVRLPASRVRVAQGLPLVQLAGMLKNCSAFVGHDSGITHLAASLGLRGLALWGPSRQAIWRPRSDRFQMLSHAHSLSSLPSAVVFSAVQKLLPPV